MLEDVDSQSLLSDGSHPIEDYIAWLNARHPEYLDEVEFVDPDRRNQRLDTATAPSAAAGSFLVLDAENARILVRYVDQYREELAATGVFRRPGAPTDGPTGDSDPVTRLSRGEPP